MGQLKAVTRHAEQITAAEFADLTAAQKLQAAKDGKLVDMLAEREAELDGRRFVSSAEADRYRRSRDTNEGEAS